MKLDHETQKYLIMRNFYRLLKSPALILYALKTYENLPDEYLSNTDNPLDNLHKIKEEFENKILIDSNNGQNKVLRSGRLSGFNLKIEEVTEIPHWKKHFFDVLAVLLTHLFYEHYSKTLGDNDLEQKSKMLKEYQIEFKSRYISILQQEVLNIHPKISFDYKPISSDYEKAKDVFKNSFFKLSILEKIYIQILKLIRWVASFIESLGIYQSKTPRL